MTLHRSAMVLMATLFASACAHIEVIKLGSDAAPAEGVIYALPKTVVRTQLKVDRTEKKPAPFMVYSPIFVPEGTPVCTDDCSVAFSVQQGATFATYGEPDPANVFLVKFTNGRTIDQTLSMTWTEAGLLSATSAAVTNRTADIIASGVKLVTGLGAKASGFGAISGTAPQTCSAIASTFDNSSSDAFFIDALKSEPTALGNYCSMDPGDRDKLKHDRPLLDKALAAYIAQVLPLVAAREQILRAKTPNFMEPATILPRLEAELATRQAALFLGTKATTTWDGAVDVRDLAENTAIPLVKIAADGICISANLPPDAKALPDKFASPTNCATVRKTARMTLNYHPAKESQLFTRLKDNAKPDELRGFRYRLPALMRATLDDDVTGDKHGTYGGGTFAVAQFGTIISLPAKRTSKTISYDLAFVEATGALKTFKLGTTGGLDAATIDALTAAGGTALDARNKARAAGDELAQLTREDAILKAKDDICTILKKYNLPCTVQPQ